MALVPLITCAKPFPGSLQERSGAGRPRDAAAEAAAPRPRSRALRHSLLGSGPAPGCLLPGCCRQPERSFGVPSGNSRETNSSFSPLYPRQRTDRHRSCCTAVSANRRLCSVPLADLLFFWHAVFTFLAVWLLVCVTLAISSQQGSSVLPIFLYNCIAVSSS